MTQVADLRQEFESLRNKPDAVKLAGLKRLRQTFADNGHNPANAQDPMYAELGVAKEFFDLVVRGLEQRLP